MTTILGVSFMETIFVAHIEKKR